MKLRYSMNSFLFQLRAFIRVALMEKRLSDYILWILDHQMVLKYVLVEGLSLTLPACLCVCLPLCLSPYLSESFSLPLSLSLSPSLPLSLSLRVSLSASLAISLSLSASLSISVCLSVCLSISLFLSLSLSLSFYPSQSVFFFTVYTINGNMGLVVSTKQSWSSGTFIKAVVIDKSMEITNHTLIRPVKDELGEFLILCLIC